jgi:hypothetical protein
MDKSTKKLSSKIYISRVTSKYEKSFKSLNYEMMRDNET